MRAQCPADARRPARVGVSPGEDEAPRRAGVRAAFTAALIGALLPFGAGVGPALAAPPADRTTALASATASEDSGGYHYWSFWTSATDEDPSDRDSGQGDDGWRYARLGPAQLRPADGSVVGFRFTASKSAESGSAPRPAADFEQICDDTAPAAGRKRVAVVIDYGTPADAPEGEKPPAPRTGCTLVAAKDSAADALVREAPSLRYASSALLCAIDDYPRAGCGERIAGGGRDRSEAFDPQESAEEESGTTIPPLAGVLVVLLLAAGAVWQFRRRRP